MPKLFPFFFFFYKRWNKEAKCRRYLLLWALYPILGSVSFTTHHNSVSLVNTPPPNTILHNYEEHKSMARYKNKKPNNVDQPFTRIGVYIYNQHEILEQLFYS